jgi:AMMECR1 domain-containing protein
MKKYIWSLLILSIAAFALAEGKDNRFNERKQSELQNIDLHLSALQSAKACFTSANDREALKRCHEEMEKSRRKIREESLDLKIHQLQEEKTRLDK